MTLAKGLAVGPYEILGQIGEGGMGEVWRARDRRIGRDVAVKILPEKFNDEAVKRFEQEARAAGALSHPGLVTIFDVGTTDGCPYIVMELLQGQTLREVIGDPTPAPMPLRRALDYAVQIAGALAVAHERGIIHRDLKPENLFVTSERRVKILDFGLAKLAANAVDVDGHRRTSRHLTAKGFAVGTPSYMSPEQVHADPVDHRTDIFSLGAVLYEMLSGQPAFDGSSAVEIMHAVLSDEPMPLETIAPDVPPALAALVHHCLEKDPRERFQSARDLAFQLRTLAEVQKSMSGRLAPSVARPRPYRTGLLVGLLLALAGVGAGFTWRALRRSAPPAIARTLKQLTFQDGMEAFPTFAPDGKSFAYVSAQSGNRDIYVQRVDGRTAIDITADSPDDDSEPAFSPDGSQIAFRSEREGGGIFVMGVTGESPVRRTEIGHNPAWSPDGTRIAFSSLATSLKPYVHSGNGDLWMLDLRNGTKRVLVEHHMRGMAGDADQPSWSPDGKRIAFWSVTSDGRREIWTIDPEAKEPAATLVRLMVDPSLVWNPVWSPDGRYLYYGSDRDGTLNLWRVAVDSSTGKASGQPEPLMLPAAASGNFSFSRDGDLLFGTAARSFRLLAFPFDATTAKVGDPRPLFGGTQEILDFAPSPDGQQMAFTSGGGVQEDLFLASMDGTRIRQLTNDAARDRGVSWSADGKLLYDYANRGGSYDIWSIRTDGSGLARVTDETDRKAGGVRNLSLCQVSPDGRTLAAEGDAHTLFVHLDRPHGTRAEVFGDRLVIGPKWSPDGSRLIGELNLQSSGSLRSGGIGMYSPENRRLQVLLNEGFAPQWLPDGRRLVFFARDGIGILDVDSRRVIARAVPPALPGVEWSGGLPPRLSRDGSTLYIRQALEQGDIWLVRFDRR